MQKPAPCAHKHLRGVGEPIGLKECQNLCVQQSIAAIEAIMAAMFTGELDTGQDDFGFFFHGCFVEGVLQQRLGPVEGRLQPPLDGNIPVIYLPVKNG